MDNKYQIVTEAFEGPFDLLLHLIDKRKLFINDLSLAEVTADYISYMREQGSGSITDLSSFISVASTLILIKSKSLLPKLELSNDEEEDVSSLKRRLELYQLFQSISVDIARSFGRKVIYPQGETKRSNIVFSPDEQITIDAMLAVAGDVLSAVPAAKEKLPEISISKVMSIDQMITGLTERISSSLSMSFKDFSDTKGKYDTPREERIHVIVSFLAVLEMAREGILSLVQENHFDDITINKKDSELEEVNEEVTIDEL
ncbi:MAG: segregation and condensation protein A [Candidatus Paceibacteria bacterium]|jgi:segregation and condensation protein A